MAIHELGTLTADGSTGTYTVKRSANAEKGELILVGTGTYGGGTLTFEISVDGGTTYTSMGSDAEFTEDGNTAMPVLGGDSLGNVKIRGTLSGATSPDLNVTIADNY